VPVKVEVRNAGARPEASRQPGARRPHALAWSAQRADDRDRHDDRERYRACHLPL